VKLVLIVFGVAGLLIVVWAILWIMGTKPKA